MDENDLNQFTCEELPLFQTADADKGTKITTNYSDIDFSHWKDYLDTVITDSLWLLGRRDNSGPHSADYWGNFVPQIPHQVMLRFTKRYEIVVDLFSGLGTTLIECKRLGRHGIGVELNKDVALRSKRIIARAENPYGITTKILAGLDSTTKEARESICDQLKVLGVTQAHCLILHPPYHDIIKFSDSPRDLSNASSVSDFLEGFSKAVENAVGLLQRGRFLALVIGDKYVKGEWIPLGFECMRVCQSLGLTLKAINVKDIQGNERGKGVQENLWRYRALKGGFYIFKHEYIMILRKS